jgi:hypothetical protein
MPPKQDDDELKKKFVETQEREQRQREERRLREEERERRRLEETQKQPDGAGAVVVDDALMSRLETIFMQLDARNAKRQADQEKLFTDRLLAMENRIRSEVIDAKTMREADEDGDDKGKVFDARVPATTVPPPKLAFMGLDVVTWEAWKIRWTAYL